MYELHTMHNFHTEVRKELPECCLISCHLTFFSLFSTDLIVCDSFADVSTR